MFVEQRNTGQSLRRTRLVRQTMLALAMASVAAIAPASARDGAFYMGVEGGVILPQDVKLDFRRTGAGITVEPDIGWEGGLVVGYDFGGFRLEAEGGYKEYGLDEARLGRDRSVPSDGDVAIVSSLVNGMLDFGGEDGVGFSVGGGLGVARVDVSSSTPFQMRHKDDAFAWQLIAAMRVPVSSRLDLGLKYRYFNAEQVHLHDHRGGMVEGDFRSHSGLATLVYNFGRPSRPVPPPPPPPPPREELVTQSEQTAPPAPPAVRCNTGPYLVFFDFDQASITPEAALTLDSAVTAYSQCGAARVALAGHTDRAGSNSYNQMLAERRNGAVREYLISRGIPSSFISATAFGETMPRVPTADGVREPQNRRVEITYTEQ